MHYEYGTLKIIYVNLLKSVKRPQMRVIIYFLMKNWVRELSFPK